MQPPSWKALLDDIARNSQPIGRSASEIEQSIKAIQAERAKLQAEIDLIRKSRTK